LIQPYNFYTKYSELDARQLTIGYPVWPQFFAIFFMIVAILFTSGANLDEQKRSISRAKHGLIKASLSDLSSLYHSGALPDGWYAKCIRSDWKACTKVAHSPAGFILASYRVAIPDGVAGGQFRARYSIWKIPHL
jgi:hypothetical protein